jgi:hypothetical protein
LSWSNLSFLPVRGSFKCVCLLHQMHVAVWTVMSSPLYCTLYGVELQPCTITNEEFQEEIMQNTLLLHIIIVQKIYYNYLYYFTLAKNLLQYKQECRLLGRYAVWLF